MMTRDDWKNIGWRRRFKALIGRPICGRCGKDHLQCQETRREL